MMTEACSLHEGEDVIRKPMTPEERTAVDRFLVRSRADFERDNADAQAAIACFLKMLDQLAPPEPRQRAARRGLRVIEGGKRP